jgi:hypothetical protein
MSESEKPQTYRYTGAAHPFYQYGECYTLHVFRNRMGMVRIEVHRGKEMPINKSVSTYITTKKFEECWTKKEK